MILVVHEPRVKAPVRWTFAVGNFDDNKKNLGKKFHLTVLQATPEQSLSLDFDRSVLRKEVGV